MSFNHNCYRPLISRHNRPRVRWMPPLASLSVLLCVAVTVLGCGWDIGSDHSVRFNPYRTEKEFGRLPPLPKYVNEDSNRLFSWDRDVAGDEVWPDEDENKAKGVDNLWAEATEAQTEGRLGDLRRCLRKYLERTEAQRYSRFGAAQDTQQRRNAAVDKLDALAELERETPEAAVGAYLAARSAYDAARGPDEVLKLVEPARASRTLRDNVEYLEAALRRHGDERAAADFERLAARYPDSEKREAALFMAAVIAMKLIESRKPESETPTAKKGCDECQDEYQDEYWRRAHAGFKRVMLEYPGGRYYSDARGWLGRLSLVAGDRVGALVEYYRLLGDKDEGGRVEALFSLAMVRHQADELEMEKVEEVLEHEPRAALAYAYHNIFNFALSGIYRFRDEESESENEERDHELTRIASFATRMINRFPARGVGAAFVVRTAEANLELGNDAAASKLARRALAMGAMGDIRAEALWVAGAAELRRRQYAPARQALTTLVAENPDNRYTEGARRQLAMLLEDAGDIEGALDQYLALDYRYDVAYFIDVLMTPDQLKGFIDKRPSMANRDEMVYALGVRYLRDRRWNDARAVFARVKTVGRDTDAAYFEPWDYEARANREHASAKEDFDRGIRGIRPHWIDQDMRTANEIEHLERQVEAARDDDARAEALYQVASYQFERSLLFYNPLAWKGIRHYQLYDLDQRGAFRQANESQALFDHMQEHDMAANSLPIFLEVVRRFPNTRAARDALFTAAVCHERLRGYNNYWSEVYSEGGHAGGRLVSYRDVRAAYPGYRFPRGTFAWEPATRTVNGGPGWDKPPKPRPRPTRLARGVKLVSGWMNESFKLWNRALTDLENLAKQLWRAIVAAIAWVFHWLWILAMCGWLWFLWRRASEARLLLNEALSCCKGRPPEERANPESVLEISPSSSVLARYMNQDVRTRWLEAACELEYKLARVVQDRRGVVAVAYYAASHGMFVILLVRLLVNL